MDEITIEVLGPEDAPRLLSQPDGLFDNAPDPEQTKAFLSDPLHEIVGAFSGPLMVSFCSGTVLFHPDKPPSLFINEVGTRDEWLRRGLATKVIERMLELARDRGCKGIWLGTEAENGPALALYRSMKAEEVAGRYFGWDGAF